MTAGDAGIDRFDLDRSHEFRLVHRPLDGFDGALDIDHDALTEATRRTGTDPDDVHCTLLGHFGHDGTNLGRPDVQPHDDMVSFGHLGLPPFPDDHLAWIPQINLAPELTPSVVGPSPQGRLKSPVAVPFL